MKWRNDFYQTDVAFIEKYMVNFPYMDYLGLKILCVLGCYNFNGKTKYL